MSTSLLLDKKGTGVKRLPYCLRLWGRR